VSAPVIHLVSVFPDIDSIQKLVVEQDLAWQKSGYVNKYEQKDGSFATSEFITNGHKYHNWYELVNSIVDKGKRFCYL
jgi:hypothetical protein